MYLWTVCLDGDNAVSTMEQETGGGLWEEQASCARSSANQVTRLRDAGNSVVQLRDETGRRYVSMEW